MYSLFKNLFKAIYKQVISLKVYLWKFHYKVRYKGRGNYCIYKSSQFQKHVRLLFRKIGFVSIGANNNIQRDTRIVIDGGSLTIGNGCSFGESNIINVFDNVTFGNRVLTADRVNFISNIHIYDDVSTPICEQATASGPISVGDGTWFGINATVLANTSIGKNCVIAAHSVVKGNFPDYCVIAGTPARIVKKYNMETGEWIKWNQ